MNDTDIQQSPSTSRERYFPSLLVWLGWGILAVGIAVLQFTDVVRDNAMANVFSFGLFLIGVILFWFWFLFRSDYAKPIRLGAFAVFAALIGGFFVCFRIPFWRGDMTPANIVWRWSEPPDTLLAAPKTDDEPVDLTNTTPDDFPQFLGPNRDLSLTQIRLKTPWLSYPPELLWKKNIGAGWSAFSVVNRFAVTMEQRGDDEMVTCYEVETGKIRWAYSHKARYETRLGYIGPRATPTIKNGKVYALGATGWLVCLNGENGELIWKKNLLTEFGKTETQEAADYTFGRSSSPLIVDDTVVVSAGGPPENRVSLAAFYLADGELAWKGGERHIGYASPTLVTFAAGEEEDEGRDRQQIIIVNEAAVSGHVAKSGKELWHFDWPGESNARANSSQAVPVMPDKVYVSKGYRGGSALVKLVPNDDGKFDVETVWKEPRNMRTKFTNVAMKDGYVYGLSDGILECQELETGERVWKGGRYGHGQILRVSDHLIVSSEDGEVFLVEATPDRTNNVLGQIEGALSGTTWNNIALYGPYLLIRNASEAVCYRLEIERK